ncbi:MAG: type II toxin-antitoxin system RelE/ParE family toxin [Gammaproteobacteria bacterium]
MTIRWSARARSDIRDLQQYIAKDSPYYARQFITKIFGAVEKLVDHPKIGRRVPEAHRDDVRELVF